VKRAVALSYEADLHDAPVVVSSGEGDLAERIERMARDHGIAVVRDLPLAEALSELQVGEPIPEALYQAVAAILGEIATDPRSK
jgi:type III secretion system FlhB-like substrate exporter